MLLQLSLIVALVASVSCAPKEINSEKINYQQVAEKLVSKFKLSNRDLSEFATVNGTVLYSAYLYDYNATAITMTVKESPNLLGVKDARKLNNVAGTHTMTLTVSIGKPQLSSPVTYWRYTQGSRKGDKIDFYNFTVEAVPVNDITFDVLVVYSTKIGTSVASVVKSFQSTEYTTTSFGCHPNRRDNVLCDDVWRDLNDSWFRINMKFLAPVIQNSLMKDSF